MKNFIKSSLIICLIIFVSSCSKDEKAIDVPKETISLEEGLDINFDDLTAITLDGETDVDADGGFQADVSTTLAEELPILFTKGEDVMFGYYSKTGANNTVSIDDILLFYFSAHPEVAIQGLSNSVLSSKIKSSVNYTELKNMISTSLIANTSPFKNNSFVELLNDSGYNLATETRGYKQTKVKGDVNFQYTYSRDGKVSWEKEFPLFATVGMEIVDEENKRVKTYLFEKSGLVASPSSLISWVWDLIVEEVEGSTESYQFTNDGIYTIAFSNGVDGFGATPDLESEVDAYNRLQMAADVISITSPITTKHFFKKIDDACVKEIVKLFKDLNLETLNVISGDKFKLDEFIKTLSENVYKTTKQCIPEANIKLLDAFYSMQKYFNVAEDTAELVLFIRDYIASDITGKETRYFYNNTSYGKLFLTNLSGDNNGVSFAQNEFVGEEGSEHKFKGRLTEELYTYNVVSGIAGVKSTITPPNAIDNYVENFPFIAEKLSGNAEQTNVNSSPAITNTNSEGKLEMTFKMGTQNSQFEIKPAFEGKGLPEAEIIDLKLEECLKPLITDVEVICPTDSGSYSLTYEVIVSFDTGVSAVLGQEQQYQVGLEFQQYGTGHDYQYADNSFYYSLISGDIYKGVYEVLIGMSGTNFCTPTGTRTELRHWHNFRVYLTNGKCNYKSEYSYFETTYY